jgi:hypothetical protein
MKVPIHPRWFANVKEAQDIKAQVNYGGSLHFFFQEIGTKIGD